MIAIGNEKPYCCSTFIGTFPCSLCGKRVRVYGRLRETVLHMKCYWKVKTAEAEMLKPKLAEAEMQKAKTLWLKKVAKAKKNE